MNMSGINLKNVSIDDRFPAIVRLTAIDLLNSDGYFSWGRWLNSLSNDDLVYLRGLTELDLNDPINENAVQSLILITEMLAQAEGLDLDYNDASPTVERMNWFSAVLTIESLHRKGLVKVFYENLTMDSMDTSKIAQLIK